MASLKSQIWRCEGPSLSDVVARRSDGRRIVEEWSLDLSCQCEMKAFLIFQSVARGLEAVSRRQLASIGGLGGSLRSLRGRAPMTRKVTRLAPCNILGIPGKQAYVKAIKVNEASPVLEALSQ